MDFAVITDLAQALETSALGQGMRGGRNWYPIANVAHLFGLVLLVGGIGVLDLRIAGLGRGIPIAPLSKLLTPLAVAGLLIQLVSGFMLFAADAGPLVSSPVFQAKMALVALGVVNALVFRRWFADLSSSREPTAITRAVAVLSICNWLVVAGLGRLIAYV